MTRVQFGSGGNQLPDFINHDAEVDISKPLPYEDSSVDLVFIEHCLEHVGTHAALRFLTEAYRILKPEGVIRVCVPSLDRIRTREHARDLVFGHGHLAVYSEGSLGGMMFAAGFDRNKIIMTVRSHYDGHWRVIGREKDDTETLRMEATK